MARTHTSSLNALTTDGHFMSYTANRSDVTQFCASRIALKRPEMSQNLPWQTVTAWRQNAARILRAPSPEPQDVANNQRPLTDKHVTWSVNITSLCDVTSCCMFARYRRFEDTYCHIEIKLTSCVPVARYLGFGWICCLHLQIKIVHKEINKRPSNTTTLYITSIRILLSTSRRHHRLALGHFKRNMQLHYWKWYRICYSQFTVSVF